MLFSIIDMFRDNLLLAVLIAVLCLTLLLMSMSCHEFGHAYIAYKNGDPTAKYNGRMTLNPIAHLDIIGLAMLVFVGFGYAKPVPVNFSNLRNKRSLFFVAVAGVTINIILAVIFSFIASLCYFLAPDNGMNAANITGFVFYLGTVINIAFFVFNLIPIFPLDGFRVVESFTSYRNKFVMFMRRYGSYILIGLIVWSLLIGRICEYVPSAAPVLKYFDVLGFVINFFAVNIANGLFAFWGLIGF